MENEANSDSIIIFTCKEDVSVEEEDKYNKISFDGRIKYHDELHEIRRAIIYAMFGDDLDNWIKGIDIYITYVVGFAPKEIEGIIEEFDKLKGQYSNVGKTSRSEKYEMLIQNQVKKNLLKISRKLFTLTKDLLSSTSTEGTEDDINMGELKRLASG